MFLVSLKQMSTSTCVLTVVGVGAVLAAVAIWYEMDKKKNTKNMNRPRRVTAVAAPLAAREDWWGCDAFRKACVSGEVGGCQQYKTTCATHDNNTRATMAVPGECEQLSKQCADGDYVSCDLHNRSCQYD